MSEDWLEGAPQKPKRGELFSQNRLRQILGFSPPTFAGLIKEGAPVVSRGGRTQSWELNSADFVDWYVDRAVAKATNNLGDAYDVAKTRDKEAQARRREFAASMDDRTLIEVETVCDFLKQKFGHYRSHLLSFSSQIPSLTDEQRAQLTEAVDDLLSEFSGHRVEDWKNVDFDEESEAGD